MGRPYEMTDDDRGWIVRELHEPIHMLLSTGASPLLVMQAIQKAYLEGRRHSVFQLRRITPELADALIEGCSELEAMGILERLGQRRARGEVSDDR